MTAALRHQAERRNLKYRLSRTSEDSSSRSAIDAIPLSTPELHQPQNLSSKRPPMSDSQPKRFQNSLIIISLVVCGIYPLKLPKKKTSTIHQMAWSPPDPVTGFTRVISQPADCTGRRSCRRLPAPCRRRICPLPRRRVEDAPSSLGTWMAESESWSRP